MISVTIQRLKERHACYEGIRDFKEVLGESFHIDEWDEWAQAVFCSTKLKRYIVWCWREGILPLRPIVSFPRELREGACP